jgi:hypothetical protein
MLASRSSNTRLGGFLSVVIGIVARRQAPSFPPAEKRSLNCDDYSTAT